MRFVLDASVALRWCLKPQQTSYSLAVLRSMTSSDAYVPLIWPAEVASVVSRELNKQTISLQDAIVFFDMVQTFRIHIVAGDTDPASIFSAARQHRLSGYDATYVELAIALGLPLASADEDMCDAARRAGVSLFLPPSP